ncbi:acyl-CoA dehydrogenase family protein [Ramlibacter albus]|uniref:Acyl-CoA/acyl-ACP dehydrogenase n=1 Tax=Ramlibacter albus TaxID=2079448 RepID=A0A923M4T0_9BURK|nr:acyl-CoA dehydrogenase family protein [Ramlibacter albus]MBC5762913.1 acyl-CoA/acyl-ACP dehydrogenase [Ramlibacter albus]
MDFGLSDDQRAFQDAFAQCLTDFSSTSTVRRILDGDAAAARALQSRLNEVGATGIVVPPEHGGLGLGVLDAAIVFEMLGRYVAPVDLTGSVLTSIALSRSGSESQKAVWLRKLVEGTASFGTALTHAISDREGGIVSSVAGRLNGRSFMAACPPDSTHLLVPDSLGALWIVTRDSPGLRERQLVTVDRTRGFCTLEMEDVVAERLAHSGGGELLSELIAIARVLISADALGASQRMLEMAVAYAHDRKQFGVPIGSFQAVKHLCAEMAAEIEPCHALLWFASHSLDQRLPDAVVSACHAKARIADVSQFVARAATEVHGGIGFTDELGLHWWFKRIAVDRQLGGGPELIRAEAAWRQGWTDGPRHALALSEGRR